MSRHLRTAQRWLGASRPEIVTRVGLGLMLAALIWTVRADQIEDACLERYAEASARGTVQRAQAAAEDRAALDKMVDAVINAKSAGDSRAALLAYQETRRAADKLRAEHPVPPPPSQVCR